MNEEPILLRVDAFIWSDESLNYPEKIVLNLIFSFTIREECCSLSDEWIASKFGWSAGFSADLIKILAQRGWVKVHYPWGGNRTLSLHIPGRPDPCDAFSDAVVIEV